MFAFVFCFFCGFYFLLLVLLPFYYSFTLLQIFFAFVVFALAFIFTPKKKKKKFVKRKRKTRTRSRAFIRPTLNETRPTNIISTPYHYAQPRRFIHFRHFLCVFMQFYAPFLCFSTFLYISYKYTVKSIKKP